MTKTFTPGFGLAGAGKWARTLALGLAAGLGLAPLVAQAQLVLSSAAPKTENFDGLGSSATASLPDGFVLASGSTGISYANAANTAATTRSGGTSGTGALASNSAGGAYNFASGVTATATDRALGFLSSGSYTVPRHILLAVQNNTGATISSLGLSYDIEKYRTGTNAFEWQLWTSPDGSTWTQVTAATQTYPADAANAVANPATTTAKSATLSNLNLSAGATTYLRWTYTGTASTNAQGLGLDNLTLTPALAGGTTTPPPAAATISTGSVSPTSFCVTSATGSSTFSVPFTTTGTFSGAFSVQLSDASGAFTSTTGSIIGTGSASPIAATIPAGTASGTGYRVRVLGSSPTTIGTDNGANLTVNQSATSNTVTVTPSGTQSVTTTGTGATLTASAALSGSTYSFQYGTSAGGPYAASLAAGSTYQLKGSDFPGAGTYYVVAQATAATACGSVAGTSDPVAVTVTAPATAPVVTVSATSLPDFGSIAVGAGSLLKSFTVSGTGLTGSLTITPPAGFEIRFSGGAFACCPLTLTPSGGSVPATTVEVRFVPTASQAYQAAITIGGQPSQTVTVSGTGVDAVYPATLSTAPVTNLAATTANAGGTIASDGGSAVTARGVVYGRAANPTVALTTKTSDGSGSGTFSSTLTGLTPGTTYFVRAYATTGVGTTYGQELSFTTVAVPLATEPTSPATVAAGTVTGTSIQLLLGGGPSQKYLVLARLGAAVDATPTDATTYTANAAFGASQAIGTGNYVVYSGSGSQVTVTGLRPSTPYYFSVFAFNDNDTPYAENYLTTSPSTLSQSTQAAPAALLLEENFDYAAGALLSASNWTAHSSPGTNSVKVVASNLSLAGYGPNSGNAAALTGNGEDVSRQFAPVYARTPTYAAFLVKVNSASTTADYFFHLGPQALGSTFRARVFVRSAGAGTGKVQFGISGGTGTAVYTSGSYDLSATHLLVVKYVFDEAGNTSQLFVNPAGNTEPATADATQTETGTTPAAPNDNIGTVALRQGTNSPNLVLDGLRVGTTYRAVKTGLTTPEPTVTVLYANGGTDPSDSDVSPFLQLVNVSGAAIPYQELTVRYYLTVENFTSPVEATIGYADLGTSGVQARYVPLPQPARGALGYIEYSFSSPLALAAGANSGQILSHIHTQNYRPLDETDDYSYATNTTYAPNDHITVYRNGTLVSGTEPATVAAVTQLRAQSANQTTDARSSTIDVVAQVDNLGTTAIPYQDLTVRYWLTPDGASALQGAVGYAQLGSSNVPLSFGQAGTETYAELRFAGSLGSLLPRAGTGQIIFHLHKADWSAFDQTNDHSFRASQVLADNPRLTVYQQGQLVYGQEPTGAQQASAARTTASSSATAAASDGSNDPLDQQAVFEAYPNPFTTRSQLHFRPAGSGPAQLVVYNTLGQVVRTLFDGPAQAGQDYSFTLEAARLSYGLYLAQLKMDGQTRTIRLVIAH